MMLAARRVATQHSSSATRALASTMAGKTGGDKSSHSSKNNFHGPLAAVGAALLGAMSAGTVTLLEQKQKLPKQKYTSPNPIPIHGKESHHSDYNDPPPRPDLPTFKLEDVAEHCDESSLWFTFRGAVYDMTFFLNGYVKIMTSFLVSFNAQYMHFVSSVSKLVRLINFVHRLMPFRSCFPRKISVL